MTRLGVQMYQEQTPHGQQQTVLEVEQKEKIEVGLLLFLAHLSDCLQMLEICSFPELSLLASSLVDHHQKVGGISGVGGLGAVGGLQALRCLQELQIRSCPKLHSAYETSSPAASCCFPFPSSLQKLELRGTVGGTGTLESLSNLTSLTRLHIDGCGEDFRGEGLWTLVTRGHLTALMVYGCPKFFVGSDLIRELQDEEDQERQLLQCSPKLRELRTDDIPGVLAAPICTLLSSSLTLLAFCLNGEVEHYTKEQERALQLLTSLQDLIFFLCMELQCLPAGLYALPSLKRLCINYCPAISSLPKHGLPISLQELDVRFCENKELEQQCRDFVRDHPRIKLI
ncbi:hypothetical protein C2845_PM16G01250 [Panicum miliaceum]|uniref:Uncharacterized protein n=1 Tax=Panicum miliaceum TaxID=4540 RepID=A0A3L6PW10_PANMI|nr:hypothetical protein C2845_PM16G01250 [Panicum miliaceum]